MWLVHETEYDFVITLVFCCQLTPHVCELRIRYRARTLSNDLVVESREVVEVDGTECSESQASLHELIVFSKVVGIKGPAKFIVHQELP